jgi:hypothetical protein
MKVSKLIKVVVLFLQTWTWTFRFSWLWGCVVGLLVPYILKNHSATILGFKQFRTIHLGPLDPLRWRHSDTSFERPETTNPNLITQCHIPGTLIHPLKHQTTNPNLITQCHIPDTWIVTTLLSEPQVSCMWACFWSHCDVSSFLILWLVTSHSWVCCYRPADRWYAGSSWCVG